MAMPPATMSCAAPTRVLCPEMHETTSTGNPARPAMALKMRGTWLASSPLADRAPAQRAEHPAVADPALREPLLYQRQAVAREVHRRPPSLGVGLGAAHQHGCGPVQFLNDIRDLQSHKLAPAQQRVVGDREQRAVARVDRAIARHREQALAQPSGEPPGLLLAPSPSPVHAL